MLEILGLVSGAGLVVVGVDLASAVTVLVAPEEPVRFRIVGVCLCLYGAVIAGAGALLMFWGAMAYA